MLTSLHTHTCTHILATYICFYKYALYKNSWYYAATFASFAQISAGSMYDIIVHMYLCTCKYVCVCVLCHCFTLIEWHLHTRFPFTSSLSTNSLSFFLFCSLQLYHTRAMCQQRGNALFRYSAMHYKGAYNISDICKCVCVCVHIAYHFVILNNLLTVISFRFVSDRIPSPIVGRSRRITRENSALFAVSDWMKRQRCIV